MNEPRQHLNGHSKTIHTLPAPIAPHLRQQILATIRSGGFAHVAAEAAGVPCEVFVHWLEEGSKPNAVEPYASFAADVRQAMAQARVTAEITAFQKEPKVWLEHGPGKETPGNPGWTGVVQAVTHRGDAEVDIFAHPSLTAIFRDVVDAMAEHPEVRRKVSRLLNNEQAIKEKPPRIFWPRIA